MGSAPRSALCRETFADEDDAEVLEEELAPILAQHGCVAQRQGKPAEAAQAYEAALKSRYESRARGSRG